MYNSLIALYLGPFEGVGGGGGEKGSGTHCLHVYCASPLRPGYEATQNHTNHCTT